MVNNIRKTYTTNNMVDPYTMTSKAKLNHKIKANWGTIMLIVAVEQ